MKKIYIYHEAGNINHFRALLWRQETKKDIHLVFREFEIGKKLITSLVRFDVKLLQKQFKNVFFYFSLFFKKDQTMIIGATPYNWKIILLYQLLKKNNYFFFTSRTVWGYKKYSRKFLAKTKISRYAWTRFIENARGVFCVNKQGKEEILKHYNVKNISLVNHSIDPLFVSANYFKPQHEKIKCIFVGRLSQSKGIDFIFEIINKINKVASQRFEFHFVGKGELEESLKEFCNKNKNSFYHGFLQGEALRNIYVECDILLLPSRRQKVWEELFGIVIIEAMSCGCVPITTDHSGPKEIISNQKSGFIFTEDDYVDKTHKILLQISNNNSKLIELQKNTFHSGQSYAPEKVFSKWNRLLEVAYE